MSDNRDIKWEEFCIQIKNGKFPMLGKIKGEENYRETYKVLEQNFERKSKSFSDVLQKVTLLNRYYSTRILSINREIEMAKYIYDNIKDEEIVTNENPAIFVDKHIKECIKEDLRHYSFLTKYFALSSFHHSNTEECLYPIYDSEVCRVIKYINKHGISEDHSLAKSFSGFNGSEYIKFYEIMSRIKTTLEKKYMDNCPINFRYLDIFLWREGKKLKEK